MANDLKGSAREIVLERVRAAKGGRSEAAAVSAAWGGIVRGYTRETTRSREAILELLTDRLRDYDAQVEFVGAAGVRDGVARMLGARNVKRMVIPEGLPAEWLPAGFEFVHDEGMTASHLDEVDGVLTGSTLAIAETGTIVLQNAPGQGRRAVSLVPDYHLCVVLAASVVETVPQAIEQLAPTARLATTFISGPSATADIEMTRIKGVHGPRFLDVIVVVDAEGAL
jgi:L-lactate dehydrogenase complex protein LldG